MQPSPKTVVHKTELETTGIVGLDEILCGGLPKNRLHVMEGDPGSGKTTMALQFLLEGVRLGQKGIYVTLSETINELQEVAASHGWTLDGIEVLELDALSQGLQDESNYTVFHPSEVELGDTIARIREHVERLDPQRVALDSVSELKILSQTAVRYRREILGLKQFFAGRKCTVLVLDDLTARDGEQQLQSIAHGVIRLEREGREYGSTRRQVHVVKLRGVRFQDGKHDFVIKTGGIEVYPRIIPSADTVPPPGLAKSNSAALDSLVGGGLDRGSSVLLMGPAGAGKTTVCSHYMLAALERGEKAVCYQFEEGRETFLQRSIGFGMHFEPFLAEDKFKLTRVNIADLSPGEFSAQVRRAVEDFGATIIVIDSLNGYLNGMPSERFLLIHMHELLNYLAQRGVVTIMTLSQHGMVGLASHGPVDISFLADSVILLRFFEAAGAVRQAISVVKRRRGSHEKTLREMRFTSHGIEVSDVLTEFQGVLSGIPHYLGNSSGLMGEPKKG